VVGRIPFLVGSAGLLGLAAIDPNPRRKVAALAGAGVLAYVGLRSTVVSQAASAAAGFVGEGLTGIGTIAQDVAAIMESAPETNVGPEEYVADDPPPGGFLLGAPRNAARISAAWRYPNQGQRIPTGLFDPARITAELALENQGGVTQEGTVAGLVTYSPSSKASVVLPDLPVTLKPREFRVVSFEVPVNNGAYAASIRPTWNGYGLGSLDLKVGAGSLLRFDL